MTFYGGKADTGTLIIPKWNLTYPGKIPLTSVNIEMQTEFADIGNGASIKLTPIFHSWYGNLEVWTVLPFHLETWLMVDAESSDRQILGRVQMTMHRGQGKGEPFRYDFEGKGELYFERDQLELPI